jgi:hypothetical protein
MPLRSKLRRTHSRRHGRSAAHYGLGPSTRDRSQLCVVLNVSSTFTITAAQKAPVPDPGTIARYAGISRAAEANSIHNLKSQSARLRQEFEALAEQWQRDTRHLSQIAKKDLHPAYFRIIGMGEPVLPLLLEALRNRPAHWFAALKATANFDPVAPGSNPSAAREAWLKWGRSKGLID